MIEPKPMGWTSDKWETPWSVVEMVADWVNIVSFDLDPCCEPHTAKASTYYTVDDDGLAKPWFGDVWLNPPYSKPRPWLDRAHEVTASGEARLVAALLPAAVDTRWFHDVVLPYAEVRFIRGRVRFHGWEGTPIPAPKTPSLVAIYRAASQGLDTEEGSA